MYHPSIKRIAVLKTELVFLLCFLICSACKTNSPGAETPADNAIYKIAKVEIHDSFWSPKFAIWQTVTVNDVFDKFEGKYKPEGPYLERDYSELGQTRNAFTSFDRVAKGERGTLKHHGTSWYVGHI